MDQLRIRQWIALLSVLATTATDSNKCLAQESPTDIYVAKESHYSNGMSKDISAEQSVPMESADDAITEQPPQAEKEDE